MPDRTPAPCESPVAAEAAGTLHVDKETNKETKLN